MFNLVFPVDNGMGPGMSGTQLVAEYSVTERKLIWKDRTDTKEATEKLTFLVLGLLPLTGPLFMVPIASAMLHTKELNVVSLLGYRNTILIPIIIGIFLEILFHIYLVRSFNKHGTSIDPPILAVRKKYITEIINASTRKSLTGDDFPPYVAVSFAISIMLLTILLIYYFILSDAISILYAGVFFASLSIMWFVVAYMLFEGIARLIVMLKFEKQWQKELEQEKNNS
ncbi:putative membrane protein [Weissella oryzae SG25]|uniref:Putative membrane protein n=1 Tax=Weissella oryzae (strain DSM 25784 / JCM 18191 / LMG 30913 / SG25) TaxID=1329250 RepID=A0A069CRW9_WEIOS|nr:hypothetical protein [Weissella oryzae]GAK30127.1 putative membrane protein [Weissella oryzae SG25]